MIEPSSNPWFIPIYVTGFAKRGLILTSDFATLMSHNFVCDQAITLKVSPTLV